MKRVIYLACALTLLLTGCGGQELANVSLIRTLGVDGQGPVAVTAVAGGEEEREIFCAQGEDVIAAQEELKTLGVKRLAVTHMGQVVLGAEASVQALWDEVIHRDSGYGATVWLAEEGTAQELLSEADDPAGRLKHLEEQGAAAPSLLEAVSALARDGQVEVPLLGLRDGELEITGKRALRWEGELE